MKIVIILSILIIIIIIGLSPISCQEDGVLNLVETEKVKQGIEYYYKTYLESRFLSSESVPSENKAETKKSTENSNKSSESNSLQPPECWPLQPVETTTPTETMAVTTVETTAPTETTQPEQSTTSQPSISSDYTSKMLNMINAVRAEQGLLLLSLNSTLCTVASSQSNDMLTRNYFSHTTPEGKNIFIILQENGIGYRAAGENIQHSYPASNASAEMYFNNWMNSSAHRENILNGNFSQIGIGFGSKDGWFVSTLVFLG